MYLSNRPSLLAFVGRFRWLLRSRSLCTRVVNDVRRDRGEYARVTDADVRYFRSLLGETNVLTEIQNVGPYNVDYLKHIVGKPTQFSPLSFCSYADDDINSYTYRGLPKFPHLGAISLKIAN